ncbi:MAG: methyltransferase domain-containing protein [Gammaproteobacteria bacterium]|nr:methyltransferase domain-containing protein [Gammaproteobacteria bacterium]
MSKSLQKSGRPPANTAAVAGPHDDTVAASPRNTPNPDAGTNLARHRAAIEKLRIDPGWRYDGKRLLRDKLGFMAAQCELTLDIGQSSRDLAELFAPDRIESVDINRGEPTPDIVDDICAPSRLEPARYDGIVCLSVLEHVYDPFAAIDTMYRLLIPGGYLLLHLPFHYRYHAPPDLAFADCYRFSRDGIAWMLRDFESVELYPIRGAWSSMINLRRFWKKTIEARFGLRAARWLDRLLAKPGRRPTDELQVSGYYVWARKPPAAGP